MRACARASRRVSALVSKRFPRGAGGAQGFGNVGYYAAKFFQEWGGMKVIGICEYDGAVYNSAGIDIAALNAYRCAST
jgi:glutamate dehydrogenase/leucine dehydrogenase